MSIDREALEKEAQELGVEFHPRIGDDKLKERVEEARGGQPDPDEKAKAPENLSTGVRDPKVDDADQERVNLTRKAVKLGVREEDLDPSWSIEKLREIVADVEEIERKRQETEARLTKAADSRARKQAAAFPRVKARILHLGHEKISAGAHVAGQGDLKYEEGDVVQIIEPSFLIYRAKGWVEKV